MQPGGAPVALVLYRDRRLSGRRACRIAGRKCKVRECAESEDFMENLYYLGFAHGVKKQTGRPWWCIRLFGTDRFGEINVIPLFLSSEEEFDRLQKTAPAQFSAVQITTHPTTGAVTVFKALDGVPKLNVK